MKLMDRVMNRPVTYRGYGTTLARLGEISAPFLEGFTVMGRMISAYINPKYMNTYIYKHSHLAEQGNVIIVVSDQCPKPGLEPYLCLLSAKPGVLS
jgi:hypothetical protein